MTHYTSPGLVWNPLEAHIAVSVRIAKTLRSWEGTKYGSGQSCKGTLADCIGFGCGVIAELRRIPLDDLPRLPPDTCFHAPETARAAMRVLLEAFAPVIAIEDAQVQPLDVVISGPPDGGPGHMMLVGTQRNTLWHVNRGGLVCYTGFGFMHDAQRLFAVYRPTDKASWA